MLALVHSVGGARLASADHRADLGRTGGGKLAATPHRSNLGLLAGDMGKPLVVLQY